MAKLEIELSEGLEARLKKVADANAVSLPEMAKFILANQLAAEQNINWFEVMRKGRQLLKRLIS